MVLCFCQLKAILMTVSDGVNKGQTFGRCATNSCQFCECIDLPKIPGYTGLKLFHSGPEGDVYTTDHVNVMIKVFDYTGDQYDDEQIRRISEISINLSKQIPEYVPEIYQKYETDEFLSLVMKKIHGVTLSKYLSERNDGILIIRKIRGTPPLTPFFWYSLMGVNGVSPYFA